MKRASAPAPDPAPARHGEQIGVTPLGVPIFAGGVDLRAEILAKPARLRPAPSDEDWMAWWREVRKGLL